MGNCESVLSKNPYDPEAGSIIERNRATIEENFSNGMRGLFSTNLEKGTLVVHVILISIIVSIVGLKDICGYADLSQAAKKARFVLMHLIPAEKTAMKDRLQVR